MTSSRNAPRREKSAFSRADPVTIQTETLPQRHGSEPRQRAVSDPGLRHTEILSTTAALSAAELVACRIACQVIQKAIDFRPEGHGSFLGGPVVSGEPSPPFPRLFGAKISLCLSLLFLLSVAVTCPRQRPRALGLLWARKQTSPQRVHSSGMCRYCCKRFFGSAARKNAVRMVACVMRT